MGWGGHWMWKEKAVLAYVGLSSGAFTAYCFKNLALYLLTPAKPYCASCGKLVGLKSD